MSDELTDKEPPLGEQSGKQDYGRAGAMIAAGLGLGYSGSPGTGTAGSYSGNLTGMPGAFGGFYGQGIPTAALLGIGTIEGTNKYGGPVLGGLAPYGVLPGFCRPWAGTYATYRIMSAHPTHVIAGASLIGQILGSEWSYEESNDAPSGAKDFIADLLNQHRVKILMECLKAVTTFGHRGFEQVFEYRNGYITLKKLKPLLPEMSELMTDDQGNFGGITNGGTPLAAEKCFLYSYDQDGDNFYGRPRLENTRRAWSNWLNSEDQLGRLGDKTSSIIPIMRYPPGSGIDSLGQPKTNFDIAVRMASGLASGRPIVVPNLAGLQIEDFKGLADFADKSLWGIDTVNMGNPGPAIEGLLNQLRYYDALMVRGMMRPERSLLEASRGGSRADSQNHADVGMTDSEMVHADIVLSINEQIVNPLLMYNFGPDARDSVRVTAAPLVDEKKLIDEDLLKAVAANPQALAQLIAHTDMSAWMDRVGLPQNEDSEEWDGTMIGQSQPDPAEKANVKSSPDDRQDMSRVRPRVRLRDER